MNEPTKFGQKSGCQIRKCVTLQTRTDLNWLHRTIQVPALLFALSCFGFHHHRWFVNGNRTTRCHYLFEKCFYHPSLIDFSASLHKLEIPIKTDGNIGASCCCCRTLWFLVIWGQWVQPYWSLSLLAEKCFKTFLLGSFLLMNQCQIYFRLWHNNLCKQYIYKPIRQCGEGQSDCVLKE